MEAFRRNITGLWRKITYNGINAQTSFYEKKRIVVFNGLLVAGSFLSILWLIFIQSKQSSFQFTWLTLFNSIPLFLCATVFLAVNLKYYKEAITISLFCFPPLLLFMGLLNHEYGVRLMMFIFCIFPFFFLHHIQRITLGFAHAAVCIMLFEYVAFIGWGNDMLTLPPVHIIYSILFYALILLFLYAILYSVKFQVWAYERSIQKRKKELQEKNDELKNLLLFRDKLTLILSHDAKVPLTGAVHLVEYLSLNEYKEHEVKKFLPLISGEIRNTLEMFDVMNKWASLKTNTQQNKPLEISASCLFETVQNQISNTAVMKEISVKNSASKEHTVFADVNSMQVVLRNLLSNAIKFTPAGGSITVDSVMNNDSCTIRIKDTGAGIAADVLNKIFAGTIISTPGTNDEKGTGLGLQICMDLVKQNNGTISCESQPGKGSVFMINLPTAGAAKHTAIKNTAGKSILARTAAYEESLFL
jgi:two-component system, sensor histidine kinase and response regulator